MYIYNYVQGDQTKCRQCLILNLKTVLSANLLSFNTDT